MEKDEETDFKKPDD